MDKEGRFEEIKKEERGEKKRGEGGAGGWRDDSLLMSSPRRQTFNRTFSMLGGNLGGEE